MYEESAGQLQPEALSQAGILDHRNHVLQILMAEEGAVLKMTRDLKGECVQRELWYGTWGEVRGLGSPTPL